MSRLYPRTVSISRSNSSLAPQGGMVGYIGKNRANETSIYTGLSASIQARSVGSRRSGTDKIAADAPGPIVWDVFLPKNAPVPNGSISDSDVVTDEFGIRYLIAAAYWNVLGWHLQTIRLEM